MTLMSLAKTAEKFTVVHSPVILTAIGVTGVLTTAVLTGKASIKAARLIDIEHSKERKDIRFHMSRKDEVKLVWKQFVPPFTAGALTVAAIIAANQIGTRRAAAMAAAFGLSEKALKEYREQVLEHLGESKEQKVRDDLAQKQVNRNPPKDETVIITNDGDVLCFEPYTGRYFKSQMEKLRKAENDLNYQVLNNFYASLSDFYDLIGLDHTLMSDDFGWNSDKMLELDFSAVLINDRPCMVMNYQVVPIKDYSRVQ